MDGPVLRVGQRRPLVDGVAVDVDEPAQRGLAHRHGHGGAGVDHLGAAREAVGGVHGDGADLVVAEVLLYLADHLVAGLTDAHLEGVVDGRYSSGNRTSITAPITWTTSPLFIASTPLFSVCKWVARYPSASAPATTSRLSCVMAAWRARLSASVRASIISSAASLALRMALIRAPCSLALDSRSAR